MRLVWDAPEQVTCWMAARIPHMHGGGFGPAAVAGVMRGNVLAAGVAFHDWQPGCGTLQVSIAGEGRWASRRVLRELFAYAFQAAGANKLWAAMAHDAPGPLDFNRRLGFRRDGVLRHHFGPGKHAVIASMMREEWRRSPWFQE